MQTAPGAAASIRGRRASVRPCVRSDTRLPGSMGAIDRPRGSEGGGVGKRGCDGVLGSGGGRGPPHPVAAPVLTCALAAHRRPRGPERVPGRRAGARGRAPATPRDPGDTLHRGIDPLFLPFPPQTPAGSGRWMPRTASICCALRFPRFSLPFAFLPSYRNEGSSGRGSGDTHEPHGGEEEKGFWTGSALNWGRTGAF